jgi:uncharacterized secreted protein with C-terminal beta-propeller domain
MKKETGIIVSLIVLVVALIGISLMFPQTSVTSDKLKKFSSCQEIKNFVQSSTESYGYGGIGGVFSTATKALPMMAQTTAGAARESAGESEDYSKTNVQVEGVDEADIVKNDGKYIYTVSGQKVVIVDAYPAENSKVLSEINLAGTPQEIFINKDKLIVFGQSYRYSAGGEYPYYSGTFINAYDISDRSSPVLKRNLTLDGSYFDSRMIGDYVYVILNQNYYLKEGEPIPMPNITSGSQTKQLCGCADVYYFDSPDYSYMFTTILSLNTQNDNEDITNKVFLMGSTQNLFVSLNNIYVTYTKHMSGTYYTEKLINDVYIPSVPATIAARINEIKNSMNNSYERLQKIGEVVQNYSEGLSEQERSSFDKVVQEKMYKMQAGIAKETEKTVVHKIAIKDGKIEYKTQGEVPGNVLNQFSMDEYNNYFRMATTTGQVSRTGESTSANHVYVLDDNLAIVGRLEDLAPGEKIYSARFIGDRCYLVTFKKTDPLFVIDLKEPTSPKVLGKLKIPGYSDYLHPYDENHIIGIGKETVEAEEGGNFAWYQGIKISLFDVSDVEHPKEVSKYNIGDRGTDSYALHDHKAFLFSKSKNLLVIPVLVAEIDEQKYPQGVQPNTYGEYVWQGAYVFDLTLENGFVLKGKVTHVENDSDLIKSGYYYSSPFDVKRSLYIDGVLYTVSDKMIKMNSLDNMNEVNKVKLPYEQEEGYYPYWR